MREGVPQAVDVRLAERLARPALGRVGDERPRELAAHDAFHPHAVEVAEACAREPFAVEALVDLGARVGRDADDGRADLDRALQPRDHPRRRPAEHLVGRRLDEGALDPAVRVGDVDEARAGGVGLLGDRAHERRVLVLGVDEQLLALAEVDAGADEQPGVRRAGAPGRRWSRDLLRLFASRPAYGAGRSGSRRRCGRRTRPPPRAGAPRPSARRPRARPGGRPRPACPRRGRRA